MPDSLEKVAEEVRVCLKCPLSQSRTLAVPGEGPADARVMLIGEGPGYYEDRQGRPFVGASGQYLEELLASIGMNRQQVFITNVVKCRPPDNRDPMPNEIAACRDYLDRQLALIQPEVIVTLGRFSMARFFPGQSITRIHGQARRVGNVFYLPLFHPAAALRRPEWQTAMVEDIRQIPRLLETLDRERAEAQAKKPAQTDGDGDDAQQLSLF